MSFTYVIADLHGRLDLLNLALTAIDRHAPAPGTIVTLGDYVDRGPDSRGVVRRLMKGVTGGWQMVCLMGNHEQMMLSAFAAGALRETWLDNGGTDTLASYSRKGAKPIRPHDLPYADIEWLEKLPLLHVDQHRVYAHAYVDPDVSLDKQDEFKVLWKRYPPGSAGGHGDRHVVHGHTPSSSNPLTLGGRTNLDTGACWTGRLAVGVFDDAVPGGPINLIEVAA